MGISVISTLVVVNNGAMSIHVQDFGLMYVFILPEYTPCNELAVYVVTLC